MQRSAKVVVVAVIASAMWHAQHTYAAPSISDEAQVVLQGGDNVQDPDSHLEPGGMDPCNTNGTDLLQAPIFHSNPGAMHTIVLNFNGYNHLQADSGNGWPTFHARSFSLDRDPQCLTQTEQAFIEDVWQRVAEDFRPFDVDVTTEVNVPLPPSTIHTLITSHRTADETYMPKHAKVGASFVGAWNLPDAHEYLPVLVYFTNIDRERSDIVADATSHQLGHLFGLNHDGSLSSYLEKGDQNPSDPSSFGPIMGNPIDNSQTQWSRGDYPEATNKQNDMAILGQALGFRQDEDLNTASSARRLTVPSSGKASLQGVITSHNDIDYITFRVRDTLKVSVTAVPTGALNPSLTAGNNLDIKMSLKDQSFTLLAESFPTHDPSASIEMTLRSGTYLVQLQGDADPRGTAGSNYGSVGQYTLDIIMAPATCLNDNDCVNDRIFCNGKEACMAGLCVSVPTCNNGESCFEKQQTCQSSDVTTKSADTTPILTTFDGGLNPEETTTATPPTRMCSDRDAYEPNNGFGQAFPFSLPHSIHTLQVHDAILCEGQGEDWFNIPLCKGQSLSVTTGGSHSSRIVLQAALFDLDSSVLSSTDELRQQLKLETASANAEALLRVALATGSANAQYSLTIVREGTCSEDATTTTATATITNPPIESGYIDECDSCLQTKKVRRLKQRVKVPASRLNECTKGAVFKICLSDDTPKRKRKKSGVLKRASQIELKASATVLAKVPLYTTLKTPKSEQQVCYQHVLGQDELQQLSAPLIVTIQQNAKGMLTVTYTPLDTHSCL
eukprot:m.123813 g.123813  ORF g.123813 m.123813 type:complete len:785 (-) comp13761_c0_seq2:80-2434(-)